MVVRRFCTGAGGAARPPDLLALIRRLRDLARETPPHTWPPPRSSSRMALELARQIAGAATSCSTKLVRAAHTPPALPPRPSRDVCRNYTRRSWWRRKTRGTSSERTKGAGSRRIVRWCCSGVTAPRKRRESRCVRSQGTSTRLPRERISRRVLADAGDRRVAMRRRFRRCIGPYSRAKQRRPPPDDRPPDSLAYGVPGRPSPAMWDH